MEGQHDKDKGDPGPCADPSATGPRPPDVSKSPGDPNPNPNCLRRTRKTAPAAGQVAAPTVTAPAPLEWGRQCQAPSSIPPLHVPPWHLSISGRCTAGVLRGPTGLDRAVRPFQRPGRGRHPCRWGGCQRDAWGGRCHPQLSSSPSGTGSTRVLILPPHSLLGPPRTAEFWNPADAHAPPPAPLPIPAGGAAVGEAIRHCACAKFVTHELYP